MKKRVAEKLGGGIALAAIGAWLAVGTSPRPAPPEGGSQGVPKWSRASTVAPVSGPHRASLNSDAELNEFKSWHQKQRARIFPGDLQGSFDGSRVAPLLEKAKDVFKEGYGQHGFEDSQEEIRMVLIDLLGVVATGRLLPGKSAEASRILERIIDEESWTSRLDERQTASLVGDKIEALARWVEAHPDADQALEFVKRRKGSALFPHLVEGLENGLYAKGYSAAKIEAMTRTL